MRTVAVKGIGRVFVDTELEEIVIDDIKRATSNYARYEPEARFNARICQLVEYEPGHFILERYE